MLVNRSVFRQQSAGFVTTGTGEIFVASRRWSATRSPGPGRLEASATTTSKLISTAILPLRPRSWQGVGQAMW